MNHHLVSAAQALDSVQLHLNGLSGSCQSINDVLVSTKQSTGPLLSDMERLQKDLDAVEHKGRLVHEFLEQYQLTPEEVGALSESWPVAEQLSTCLTPMDLTATTVQQCTLLLSPAPQAPLSLPPSPRSPRCRARRSGRCSSRLWPGCARSTRTAARCCGRTTSVPASS